MKKIAIIIGHRSGSQGAYSKHLRLTEYQFNSTVALMLSDIADIYERPNTRFVSEAFRIKQLVNEINKHDYELVISLHFNHFHIEQANGVEALYFITNKFSKVIAQEYVTMVSDQFKVKPRALVSVRSTKQRGGTLICGLKAPAILVEPFFGSNEYDALQFKGKEAPYSKLLRDLISVSSHIKQAIR
jgi:N-acetylmuramoyl-L-alanine amidase